MKNTKILSLFLAFCFIFTSLTICVSAAFTSPDTENWENLTGTEASNLLRGAADGSGTESFIFVFYRDNCFNSQSRLPTFLDYAQKNGLKFFGLNANEAPTWFDWTTFVAPGVSSISFPFFLVYNAEKNINYCEDNVLTLEALKNVLAAAEIDSALLNRNNNNNNNSGNNNTGNVNTGNNNTGNNNTGNNNNVNTQIFNDVPVNNSYYDATKYLSEKGIINGYDDGSFGPDRTITRAEIAAVIVRAAGLIPSYAASTFYDLPSQHWATSYVMAAVREGIINGMGDGMFAPNDNVTRQQLLKLLVCMIGEQAAADNAGGWPIGYVFAAVNNNIVPDDMFGSLCNNIYGGAPATRGEVAQYTYNALKGAEEPTEQNPPQPEPIQPDPIQPDPIQPDPIQPDPIEPDPVEPDPVEPEPVVPEQTVNDEGLYVDGIHYYIGMSAYELPETTVKVSSTSAFDWYIFDTEDYDNFFAAGIVMDTVVSLVAVGKGFTYNGYRAGDVIDGRADSTGLLTDKNDNNIIHGYFNYMDGYNPNLADDISTQTLRGESIINFHCVNAFRVYHGLTPYKWSENAAESSRLHSEDMANNNYFDHTSLDGRSMGQRMKDQGILWWSCAENIVAGHASGVHSYDAWVNSAGHRKNMLGDNENLGVGYAYNENSTYRFYATQNFYSRYASGGAFSTFN